MSARGVRRPRWWMWIAGPVVAVAAVAAYYALTERGPGRSRGGELEPIADAAGVVHVHGLGVNPRDDDLYAATHGGVFRISDDGRATRIANRHQDTMGFTVVGPDHCLASGHPDMREDLPPLLGLLESRDAARTWTPKSLLGEADFHALRHAHGTVYGYDSTGGALMASPDGRRWKTLSKTVLRDFVVSPADRDVMLATTPRGLQRSTDGGRTWTNAPTPAEPVLLEWESSERLWVLDLDGRIHLSADGGQTWEARADAVDRPEALLDAGGELYAAGAGAIVVSVDDGRRWDVFYGDEAGH